MSVPVPSLSPAGWITSPQEKADALMAYFYQTDPFQSQLYAPNVISLQLLVQQYGHDMTAFTQRLRSALELYLGRYYQSVIVDIRNTDIPANTNPKIEFKVYISVLDDGKEYSFGQLIAVADNKMATIIKLNNSGPSS